MLTERIWASKLEVGIPEIDQDHQALFDEFNHLIRQISAHVSTNEIAQLFQNLIDHTAEHFSHEETLMKDMKYSLYHSHCEIHRKLLQDAHEVARDIQRSNDELDPTPYISCLQALIIDHIIIHDSKILKHSLSDS